MTTVSARPELLEGFSDAMDGVVTRLDTARGDLSDALQKLSSSGHEGLSVPTGLTGSMLSLKLDTRSNASDVRSVAAAFREAGGSVDLVEVNEVDFLRALADPDTAEQERRREEGRALGEEVRRALDLGDRNVLGRLFGEDGSQALGRALTAASDDMDPWIQAGVLEGLGADHILELEHNLHDDDDFSEYVRRAISVSDQAGALDAGLRRGIIDGADIDALARLTDDHAGAPMTTDFLVDAGERGLQFGVGWESQTITSGGYPVTVRSIDDSLVTLLGNIAEDELAAAEVLAREGNVHNLYAASEALTKNQAGTGITEFIAAGTGSSVARRNPGLHEDALTTLLKGLGRVDEWDYEYAGDPDEMVLRPVADGLLTAFATNPHLISSAFNTPPGRPDLDRNDAENLLTAIIEYDDLREASGQVAQLEIARRMVTGADFTSDDPAVLFREAAERAGFFSGAYAQVYADVVIGEADNADARRQAQLDLLTGAVSAVPGFVSIKPQGLSGLIRYSVSQGNDIVNGQFAGTEGADARANIEQSSKEALALPSVVIFQAYHAEARAAANGDIEVPAAAREQSERFIAAVEQFDAARTDGGPPILNHDGSVVDLTTIDDRDDLVRTIDAMNDLVDSKGADLLVSDLLDPAEQSFGLAVEQATVDLGR